MTEPEPLERLKAALADRFALEREIGAGGRCLRLWQAW